MAEGSDMRVVALRAPGVWTQDTYGMIALERAKRREFEWDPPCLTYADANTGEGTTRIPLRFTLSPSGGTGWWASIAL